MHQPKTGGLCPCKRGVQRDNCPNCEGTGWVVNFAAIRARTGVKDHGGSPGSDRSGVGRGAAGRDAREVADIPPEWGVWRHNPYQDEGGEA